MISIVATKSRYSVIAVIEALGLQGNKVGREFIAINPTRDDFNPGSFSINLSTGRWADFASGDKGGDVIDLWKYIRGTGTMAESAAQIDAALAGKPMQETAPRPMNEVEYRLVSPVERGIKCRPIHPEYGPPHREYVYYSKTGHEILGVVCRWDIDGKKHIRPFFQFRSPTCTISWRFAGPTGDMSRPIYGLQKLAVRPKCVWVVEGEKACDSGQELAPDGVVVVSWQGGSSTAAMADVSHLAGLDVFLIPDRDAQPASDGALLPYSQQPGMAAMNAIAAKLQAISAKVWIVDYTPGESEHGWDLANAAEDGMTPALVAEMIRSRARRVGNVVKKNESKKPTSQLYQQLGPDFFDKKTLKNTPTNCWQSINNMFTAYGIECRQNLMTKQIEMVHVESGSTILRETLPSLCTISNIPTANIDDHIVHISSDNKYNPVMDWIKSRPWDGRSRISDLFATITVANTDPRLAFTLFFRWCISAVAMASQERMDSNGGPPAAQGVLVFVGAGGAQKSRWVTSIAAPHLSLTGYAFDVKMKDHVIEVLSSWIVEFAELTGAKSSSTLALIKGFVTRSVDRFRTPYARSFINNPRRTVFIGTENNDDYLIDTTGNRRWWTIRVKGLDVDHGIDVQQFWAEVYSVFAGGEQWWLTPDEMASLAAANETHMPTDPIAELLSGGLRWEQAARQPETCATILAQLGRAGANAADCKRAAAFLRTMGCAAIERAGYPVTFLVPSARSLR